MCTPQNSNTIICIITVDTPNQKEQKNIVKSVPNVKLIHQKSFIEQY